MKRFFLFSLLISNSLLAQVTVESFSPTGTVKSVRQVRARFSENMVIFGDTNFPAPFEIDCEPKGKGFWEDGRNWIYNFEKDLPGGIACKFTPKAAVAVSGKKFSESRPYAFNTGGPSVIQIYPDAGATIEEDQGFVLAFSVKPSTKSLTEKTYIAVDGIEEKLPVELLPVTKELRVALEGYDDEWKVLFGNPDVAIVALKAKRNFPNSATEFEKSKGTNKGKVTAVLTLDKGLLSEKGASEETNKRFSYSVRPKFYAKFTCQRSGVEEGCLPISEMSLEFSASFPCNKINEIKLVSADDKQSWPPTSSSNRGESDDENLCYSAQFKAPFPQKQNFKIVMPDIKDANGRPLANLTSFPLDIKTTEYPPLIKVPSAFGILESKANPMLPVTFRNVEESFDTKIMSVEAKAARFSGSDFTKIQGALMHGAKYDSYKYPFFSSTEKLDTYALKRKNKKTFEVVGIPFSKPGFYAVEIQSPILGQHLLDNVAPYYVHATVLVTNLSVHFKQGTKSALAWVTSLDEGKPVANALVTLRGCDGSPISEAKTDASGVAKFVGVTDENLDRCKESWDRYGRGFFAVAEKEGDFSFSHSSWDDGIESYQFRSGRSDGEAGMPQYAWDTDKTVHTVFDRNLLRTGEVIHMKHFARELSDKVFSLDKYPPNFLNIEHMGSGQVYSFPLPWDKNGTAISEWTIPKGAKLGSYQTSLTNVAKTSDTNTASWPSGMFYVEEFRVPLMKAEITPPQKTVVASTQVPVDIHIGYLAGGQAAALPVNVNHMVMEKPSIQFPMFDGYRFATGKIKEREGQQESFPATTLPIVLDATGSARVTLKVPASASPLNVKTEVEFKDPNGEIKTHSIMIPAYPSDYLVGLNMESWMRKRDKFDFKVAVTDVHGKSVAGAPVEVELVQRKVLSHRKKILGGLYSYSNSVVLKKIAVACKGKTEDTGILYCQSSSPVSGEFLVQAKTTDSRGKASYTYDSIWLWDQEPWWFEASDSDRIDLLPEKKHYDIGETAKFQVRMPFERAMALVTVERDGIITSYTQEVSRDKSMIHVPILKSYMPNVYVSAFLVRGRVGNVQPTALVDLGKPSFKMGQSEIFVNWTPHELKVVVSPDKNKYRVREKAAVKIKIKNHDGSKLPPNSEVAVAVIDEGLLELRKNPSWNLLPALMKLRAHKVATFTSQMQVVGKRHYGLKAVAQGGGGGFSSARELFDTLLYWNPRVPVDAQGNAEVSIPLNDSITSFKIVAIGQSDVDKFGFGSASIQAYKELTLYSGISPVAHEGDEIQAELTVKNNTERKLELTVGGDVLESKVKLPPKSLVLHAGRSSTLTWPVQVPVNVSSLTYQMTAKETNGLLNDAVKAKQIVYPAVPVEVLQATLFQLEKNHQESVAKPEGALPGKGGLQVIGSGTLGSSLAGVREYMAQYPYNCLEQKMSKAVALNDTKAWKAIESELPSYVDDEGLLKFWPEMRFGYPGLSSLVLAMASEAKFSMSKANVDSLVGALQKFIGGKLEYANRRVGSNPEVLLAQKLSALEAVSRYTAVTEKQVADLVKPEHVDRLPTSSLIDVVAISKRFAASTTTSVPQGLIATNIQKMKSMVGALMKSSTVDVANLRASPGSIYFIQAMKSLKARLNFTGTSMAFSSVGSDNSDSFLSGGQVNIHRFLIQSVDLVDWKSDAGRLVKSALHTQRRGHWGTTPANAWGVLALQKFSSFYEKQRVKGDTIVTLDQDKKTLSFGVKPNAGVEFPWADRPAQKLEIRHQGTGNPWITLQSKAAVPLKKSLFKGYQIKKTVTPITQKKKGTWSIGDVVGVKLEVDAQATFDWVVMHDPLPAGASVLAIPDTYAKKNASNDVREPTYVEKKFEGYRAYFESVNKGKLTLLYAYRFNQAGSFNLPPTKVEAMYAPESYGLFKNEPVLVGP